MKIHLTPMTTGFKIEYHHFFPKAQMKNRTGKELWNSLANLTFITAKTNKEISDRLPEEYVEALGLTSEHFEQQLLPSDRDLLKVSKFEDFLSARRLIQAQALNELIGLKPYVATYIEDVSLEDALAGESESDDLGFSFEEEE